jgi:cell division transport system permease protein
MSNTNSSLFYSKITLFFIEHLRAMMNCLGQLSRSAWATLLTFLVIGIAFALPLILSVALNNIQVVSQDFHNTGQINLYLKTGVDHSQVHDTLLVLNMNENIKHSRYVSPAEGLKEFNKSSGFPNFVATLKHNPLPGVIVVTPAKGLSTTKTKALLQRLNKLPSVSTAQLDMKWLQRLNAILAVGHRAALLLMILFAIAVLLIIANTIRLTTQNHREEILVIKLVRGTNSYIRRPFLYSGAVYGLVGAIVGWLLVDLIISFLHGPITHLASLYGSSYAVKGLGLSTTLYLLGAGIVLGLIASWVAVSKYIRQIEPR